MKTIKVSELSGAALDWAVAKCAGAGVRIKDGMLLIAGVTGGYYAPSTDWAKGGPIIEREGINLFLRKGSIAKAGKPWLAYNDKHVEALGPTPLIAAMRCYVVSKQGEEVEVPEELL